MYKILVVDDEFGILEVVQAYLLKEGYEVYTAMNGKQGLLLYEQAAPDLVVLDLMLPDISGEAICEAIRKTSNIPVIMLTAKKEEADRIQGLELGADDYLVKPFSPRELVIRIQGILRRVYGNNKVTKNIKSFNRNDLTINLQERQVTKHSQVVELTKNEYDLLLTFVENPNRTFTREQLIESTFGNDYMAYDRTVDVHIKNLRQKIESDPKVPNYVVTVYGVGYKFKGELD